MNSQGDQKDRNKRPWWQLREEKQRKKAYAILDHLFNQFSKGQGDLKMCLETQVRFPFHSVRNALLIGAQRPDAEWVGGYKEWLDRGIEILKEERQRPILILEPGMAYQREDGSTRQNIYAKEVYDISQTSARGQHRPQVRFDDRLLLKSLISSSSVSVRAVEKLPRDAAFSSEQKAILVKKGRSATDLFHSISLEISHVELARNDEWYSRKTYDYKAHAIRYMLCHRYGVEALGYDLIGLSTVFQGMDPKQEIPNVLTEIKETFQSINRRMARTMGLTHRAKQREL